MDSDIKHLLFVVGAIVGAIALCLGIDSVMPKSDYSISILPRGARMIAYSRGIAVYANNPAQTPRQLHATNGHLIVEW